MSEARQLTQASRCSLFLLDRKSNELVAKVFDGAQPPNNGKGAADGFEVRVLFKIRFARVLIRVLRIFKKNRRRASPYKA